MICPALGLRSILTRMSGSVQWTETYRGLTFRRMMRSSSWSLMLVMVM